MLHEIRQTTNTAHLLLAVEPGFIDMKLGRGPLKGERDINRKRAIECM